MKQVKQWLLTEHEGTGVLRLWLLCSLVGLMAAVAISLWKGLGTWQMVGIAFTLMAPPIGFGALIDQFFPREPEKPFRPELRRPYRFR